MIAYWIKLLGCDTSRAVHQCYRYERHLTETGRASDIMTILLSHGFGEVWYAQGVSDINSFLRCFKQRCTDIELQTWRSNVNDCSSFRTYRLIKEDCVLEWYIKCNLPRKIRTCIAKFRGGLSRIKVNEGRWEGIAYKDRKCTYCNKDTIENEEHFVFECTVWSSFRARYFNHPVFKRKSLKAIFETRDKNVLISLYHFITDSLNMRRDINLVL